MNHQKPTMCHVCWATTIYGNPQIIWHPTCWVNTKWPVMSCIEPVRLVPQILQKLLMPCIAGNQIFIQSKMVQKSKFEIFKPSRLRPILYIKIPNNKQIVDIYLKKQKLLIHSHLEELQSHNESYHGASNQRCTRGQRRSGAWYGIRISNIFAIMMIAIWKGWVTMTSYNQKQIKRFEHCANVSCWTLVSSVIFFSKPCQCIISRCTRLIVTRC